MKKTITLTAYNRPEYLKQALESLIRNPLQGWKLYFSIEPSDEQGEILRVIKTTLPEEVSREVITQPQRLGVRENPLFLLRKVFDEGSDINIYLEEDILVSPDIIHLVDWYAQLGHEDCLCLNFLHGSCGGDRNISIPMNDLLIRARNFNSCGFALTRSQWTSFFRPHWRTPQKKKWFHATQEGWDWAILRSLSKRGSKLHTIQPLFARATHIGRNRGTYCLPEFHDIVFSEIKLSESPGPINYRVASDLWSLLWGALLGICDLPKKLRIMVHSLMYAILRGSQGSSIAMLERVAFVIGDLGGGGSQRFASNLSMELEKTGVRSVFLLSEGVKVFEVSGRIEDIGFGLVQGMNIFRKILRFLCRISRIRQLKKKYEVQLALGVEDESNIANILSRVSEHVVLTFHRHRSHPLCNDRAITRLLMNPLMRLIYRKAALCVAVSKGVAWDYIKHYGVPKEKVRVIYNMHDGPRIREQAAAPLDAETEAIFKDPVVLTAGRFAVEKGQWHLIRSFAALKQRVPKARLVLLGEGEHKESLVALSEGLGLRVERSAGEDGKEKNDVYFMGFQKNPYPFYSRANVFILPSLLEGFSCVLTEAMACGTPVIAADCRFGPREILAPDTDFLYETKKTEYAPHGVLMPVFDGSFRNASIPPTGQETVWGEVIARFLREPELRDGYSQKGLTRSMDFEASRIAPLWMECLTRLVRSSSCL